MLRSRRRIRLLNWAFVSLVFLQCPQSAFANQGNEGWSGVSVLDNTGGAALEIPIEVPPGPGGLEPDITLRYSSLGGDGPYGVGWSLHFGEVRCSARFGIPDYGYDTCARFELDGQLLTRDGTTHRYHPFVERFQRIEYIVAAESWEVIDPDGTIFRYGVTTDARVQVGSGIARWLLSEIEDPFGNRIFISYDDTTDLGMRYPIHVTWGPGASKSSGLREVELFYGESRPDPLHDFAGGIERTLSKRLTEIRVSSYGETVRRQAFGYELPGVAYTTGRTRLAWTQRFGSDCLGDITACTGLPRREFEYTDANDDGLSAQYAKFVKDENYVVPFAGNWWVGATPVRIGDVNGDGLPDLVKGGYTFGVGADPTRIELNTGEGFVEDPAWTQALLDLEVERPRADFTQIETDFSSGGGQEVFRFGGAGIFEATFSSVERPVAETAPAAMARPEARYSGGAYEHFASGLPQPGWIEGLGRLFVTDVDSDGLADIVVSVRLGGVDEVLEADGTPIPPAAVERVPGLSVQKVYRNTGDPTLGWVADDDLAAGLPPFGIVQFESGYGAESNIPFGPTTGWDIMTHPLQIRMDPCSMRGLSGLWAGNGIPPEVVPDVCMNYVNLDPRFVDLDGDGYQDLIVLELDDPEALYQGFMDYARTDYDRGADAPPLPDNLARSVAWLQVPDAAPGAARWVRSVAHDLPAVPFQSAGEGGHSTHSALLPFAHSQPHLRAALTPPPSCPGPGNMPNWEFCAPLSYNTQLGVHFADLNRDGLTDVIWSRYESAGIPAWPEFPLIAEGVLLNTGTGWCSSVPEMAIHVESECPHATLYHPPANSYPTLPAEPSGFAFRDYVYTGSATGRLADLNADGFLDYIQAHTDKAYPGNKAWLFDPAGASASPPNAWVRDPRYDLAIDYPLIFTSFADVLGFRVLDINGDGAADVIGDSLRDGNLVDHPQAFVSRSTQSDLLRLTRNGRGGQVSIEYTSAILQRDRDPAGLETAAAQHAAETGEELAAGGQGDSVRWSPRPVVSKIQVAAPNRAADPSLPGSPFGPSTTFRYAHPRFCAETRSDLGFRIVERTQPAGEIETRHVYQAHGRAGRIARRVVSEDGVDLHNHEEDWAVDAGVPGGVPGSIDHPDVHIERLEEIRSTNLYAAGALGAQSIRRFEYDDAYGYGFIARDTSIRATGIATILREPTSDPGHSIFGLIAEEKVFDHDTANLSDLDFLRHRQITYDRGRPSNITEFVKRADAQGPGTPESHTLVYDPYGNHTRTLVHATGGDRVTDFCYDGDHAGGEDADWCPDFAQTSHSIRVGVRDAAGGVQRFGPDPGTGTIVQTSSSYTDEPARRSTLDAFGRPIEEEILDGSNWIRTARIVHDDAASPPIVERLMYAEAGADDAEAIWTSVVGDGFGGVWKQIGETPQGFVASLTFHEAAARRVRRSLPIPCLEASCEGETGALLASARTSERDALGRLVRSDSPAGFSIYAYDSVAHSSGPGATGLSLDRMLEKNGKGDLVSRAIDGERVVWIDECGGTVPATTTEIDATDCGASGTTRTHYEYSATGELHAIHDPRATPPYDDPAHVFRVHRDTLSRIVQIDDPALAGPGHTTRAYDTFGNLAVVTNARQQSRLYSHDALNRLTGITTPSGETNYTVSYRPNERRSQGDGSDDYQRIISYDGLGRVAQALLRVRDASGALRDFYTDYDYDLLGRVVRVNHPARHYAVFGREDTIVRYEYDGAYLDQVCELGGASDCDSATIRFVRDVAYDDLGRIASYAMADGLRSFGYSSETHRLESDDFASSAYQYSRIYESHDEIGNVLSITGTESASPALDMDEIYAYDERNRLRQWTKEGNTFDYLHDDLGNLTNRAGLSQTFDDPLRPFALERQTLDGEIMSVRVHDEDGNVEAILGTPNRHFEFDSANRVVCLSESATSCDTRIAYDVSGRRIADYPAGGRAFNAYVGEDFVYSHGHVVTRASLEIRIGGKRIALKRFDPELRVAGLSPGALVISAPWLISGVGCTGLLLLVGSTLRRGNEGAPLHPLRAATTLVLTSSLLFPSMANPAVPIARNAPHYSWELSDPLGTGLVMLDSEGRRLRHQTFTPFGRVYDRVGQRFNGIYAGHHRDDASGLVYMNARWLDPSSGRFLSADPILFPETPSSTNPYSYAANNPIRFNDPTGLFSVAPSGPETEFINGGEYGWGQPSGGSHPVRPIAPGNSPAPPNPAILASFAASPAVAAGPGDAIANTLGALTQTQGVTYAASVTYGSTIGNLGPVPLGFFTMSGADHEASGSTEFGLGIAVGRFAGAGASSGVMVQAGTKPAFEVAFVFAAAIPPFAFGPIVDARVSLDTLGARAQIGLARGSGALAFIGVVGQGPAVTLELLRQYFFEAGEGFVACGQACMNPAR